VVASLVLHLGAGVALVARDSWWPREDEGAAPDMPDDAVPPPPSEQRITLGDTESTAVSMTWIGYDEYRKHAMDKAEVEQAALERDPSGGGRPFRPVPAPDPAAMAQAIAEPAAELAERVVRAIEALPMPPAPGPAEVAAAENPAKEAVEAEPAPPAKPSKAAEASQEPTEQRTAQAQEPTPKATPGEGEATGAGKGAAIAEGEQSDRESDASSIVDAPVRELGQPLAARGLRIATTKPRLSYRTQILGGGVDPVVRIFFASDGRVRNVEFLRRSGNSDIDRPVEDALYNWRAEGEALGSLGDARTGETISVDVRVIR
jgi:outer membrane biosynthesis protein TonB